LLYNEYLDFHEVEAAGALFCPTNAILSDEIEERAKVYLCCTMSTLIFIFLKRPRRGAVQLMPPLVTTLKKEKRYSFAFQCVP
jgi:hypothetical protein